jgi:hypothetical protein
MKESTEFQRALPFQNLLVPGDDEETTFTLETRPISVTWLEF